jgi:hypothetical protein
VTMLVSIRSALSGDSITGRQSSPQEPARLCDEPAEAQLTPGW